jgi:hypothetical protein
MDLRTVKVGVGLGDVRFGINRAEAELLLGTPDEVLRGGQEFSGELWVYQQLGVALGFEREDQFRLGSIEARNRDVTVNGHALIGRTVEEAAAVLRASFSFSIEASLNEDGEPEQLRLPDLAISFWFESGLIESISWSVMTDERKELLWPEASPN